MPSTIVLLADQYQSFTRTVSRTSLLHSMVGPRRAVVSDLSRMSGFGDGNGRNEMVVKDHMLESGQYRRLRKSILELGKRFGIVLGRK